MLANLSGEALSGQPIADIAVDAVTMIGRVLEVSGAAIWLVQNHGAIAPSATLGEQVAEEVVCSLIEKRQSLIRDGRALLVIAGPDEAAGLLAVTSPRRLRADEVHFLTAIANVLAHAIARGHTEEELRTRAAQQIAIAQFGRLVLLGI